MADIEKVTIKEMRDIWREDYDPEKFSVVKDASSGNGGDYNDLRDGDLYDSHVRQVVPVEVKKIEYREVR